MTWRSIARWLLWPICIAAYLGSVFYWADFHDPASISRATGLGALGLLVASVVIELILPYRADWQLRGDRDVWRNMAHTILHTQVGMQGGVLLVVLGVAPLLARLSLPHVWPTEAPYLLQVFLFMVVGDGLMYWWHRLAHRVPNLWAIHAVHHMPQRVNNLMAGRHHVLYGPTGELFVGVPLLLLGAPPLLFAWRLLTITIVQNISHADIDFRVPKFMHRVLVTPQYHRVHHSDDPRHANSNFAVTLPLWDILFGTFIDPVATPVKAAGIEGDPVPHTFLTELASPFNVKRWKAT